jgi:hypothetical protein
MFMGVKRELAALTSEVTIIPADDPARASWFVGARLSAQPVQNVGELRAIVDERLGGARARVARAETELAKQLAADIEGYDEAVDDELIAHAAALRCASGLPENAEALIARLRRHTQELSAASTIHAEAEAAAVAAEQRLEELAPGSDLSVDVELLREVSQDVILAEAAARAAQRELGAATGAVRPEQRIALRVAGRRAFEADLRLKQVLQENRPLVGAASALILVAAAALGAAAAGAVGWPAAIVLGAVLAVVALASLLQRRRAVHPARQACASAERDARRLGDELRQQEEKFGDWGVRVMSSMAADDALRTVLHRWQTLVGHGVDPEHVEELIDTVAELEAARARREQAARAKDDCAAAWSQIASELGIPPEPAPEPVPTLDLLERALTVRAVADDRLHDLHEAERRLAARERLAELLRGRTIAELEAEADELTAAAGEDGSTAPLLYVDQHGISLHGRVELMQEAQRLGPDGRFVIVTADPGEWNAARTAMTGADGADALSEIDLRESVASAAITESRPWFASS